MIQPAAAGEEGARERWAASHLLLDGNINKKVTVRVYYLSRNAMRSADSPLVVSTMANIIQT